MDNLATILVDAGLSLGEAMQRIGQGARGIVLLVDDERRLKATITDGDVRRGILSGLMRDDTVAALIAHKQQTGARETPAVGAVGQSREALLAVMQRHRVAQLPLIDEEERVADLVTLAELVPEADLPVQAVIMAGGFGKRLSPLTDETPKPMLPVAGKPLMQRTIERLRDAGIRRIHVTTHYKPEKISEHFGDGSDFGVELRYVPEARPLGTAGSVGLVDRGSDQPLLVMNGDILTSIDFRAMLSFHRQQQADLTVAVRQYDLQVPYGVVEAEQGLVRQLREKPKYDFLVNAGIYLLEPAARDGIPDGERYDMTELIGALLAEGRRVASFPIVEYWLDIGRIDDFQRAQQDADDMRWAA